MHVILQKYGMLGLRIVTCAGCIFALSLFSAQKQSELLPPPSDTPRAVAAHLDTVIDAVRMPEAVIVDTRTAEECAKGRIPRSRRLADFRRAVADAKEMPDFIVVYGRRGDLVNVVRETESLVGLLKRNVYYYTGGFEGWSALKGAASYPEEEP